MKTLIILFILIGCGKKTEYKPELRHHEGSLPSKIAFSNNYHQANFKIQSEVNHLYFENTEEVIRYHPYDLGSILPDTIYQFNQNYPKHFDLYLHDQGVNKLLDPSNIKFSFDLIDRMQTEKSYLFLAANSELNDSTLIHHIKENKFEITTNTLKEYLKLNSLKATILQIDELLSQEGDNIEKWWVKSNGNQHKLIFSSSNELKDRFFSIYQYKRESLKRVNGQAQNFKIQNYIFFKITGKKIIQEVAYQNFTKEFYTQNGMLPYSCTFTQASSVITKTIDLSRSEISKLINDVTPGSWNQLSLNSLQITVPRLDNGYFDTGLVARKCRGSTGAYPISKTRVNTERELELIIESYTRR